MEKAVFGQFVSENRKALGLTQKDLAERLHVTDKAVSKWERGLSFPDVTLLEPLASVFGMGVTELVACRRAEPSPSPAEWTDQEFPPQAEKPEDLAVQTLLDISGESLRAERKRKRRLTAALALLLLAALAALALALTLGRSAVTENGSIVVLCAEEQGGDRYIFVEEGAHLLRLRCGSGIDWHRLRDSAGQLAAWQAEYRWDSRTYQGELLRCEPDLSFLGRPMDEVGAKTDLYAYEGDALFGFSRVMVQTLAREPNPWGEGYISTYAYYLGDDIDDWYRHADEELFRASHSLGYGSCGDGGFRTADFDGDGVRELLVRTPWPEKPCILYDWTDGTVTETWLDALPPELTGPAE